jgi:CRP/FNR family transcriptional regulator, cyclic AMP receptor protein
MDPFPYLKLNPLLRGFTDDGVRIIQAACQERQLEPGMPIFVERMMGESLFFLAHGEVSVLVTRNGAEREIGVLVAPDAFGELSIVQPGPRRVSTRARSPVLLYEVPRRDFLTLQKQRPQACLKLVMNITERFALRAVEAGPLLERLPDLV